MSQPAFPSNAEIKASQAQEFGTFSKFNLVGVRSAIRELLAEIGKNGIFAEYTRHDISHIDTLLGMLDWLIIPKAQAAMTATDWMIVVLSIYFHDAGLIVTKNEFDKRHLSSFPAFKATTHSKESLAPYRERVNTLPSEERERFLYQEFVRTHHAKRIKLWINGEESNDLGVATEAKDVIRNLVEPLDSRFTSDLALVCESHHLDDLGTLAKYNPRRAYGSDLRETANLQFAAILLRTVDLLHVTKDRTPSVTFQLTSPSDPKSTEEWSKQMQVVAVRKSLPRDESGKVDADATPDTVTVSATFYDPLGFFSLTEYLFYTEQQLRQSHGWAEKTRVTENFNFFFPWRKIDSAQVQAVGFESKQFAFELDKPKILNLLTGHTLYSNSNVVVRELIQNSLDATRLQSEQSKTASVISLHLDTYGRRLTIDDNGTGMTQAIIEDHFLNVGSSRYREDSFRKQHPNFAAISRFGIGILSTFMISDEIEVITKAESETSARNISIRSINGRYLIRLVNPTEGSVPELIKQHGTRIQLKIRAGTGMPDLKEIADYWIIFPGCDLKVKTDDGLAFSVGYQSPKVALEAALVRAGVNLTAPCQETFGPSYKVVEKNKGGLTLAVALEWSDSFKNWGFASPDTIRVAGSQKAEYDDAVALCVHGIRVDNSSPGFKGRKILSISNISGATAPATNVARSGLEEGTLTNEMLAQIYRFYADHVGEEILEMSSRRGLSLSKAASEGRFLLHPLQALYTQEGSIHSKSAFLESLRRVPCLTIDRSGVRSLVTLNELDRDGGFWTLEGSTFRSTEELIRRMPNGVSLAKVASLSEETLKIPNGDIVSGASENLMINNLLSAIFEIDKVIIRRGERQINLHWKELGKSGIWKSSIPPDEKGNRILNLLNIHRRVISIGLNERPMVLQESAELEIEGAEGECGVKGESALYIFKGNGLHEYLTERYSAVEGGTQSVDEYAFILTALIWRLSSDNRTFAGGRSRVLDQMLSSFISSAGLEIEIQPELRSLVENSTLRLFDPARGERNSEWLGGFDFWQ